MAGNTFGQVFKVTTFGESHGPAIGVVVDGVPPNIPLVESDIQFDLDRRKPGQSKITTQRKEADIVKILSGVFEGKTTIKRQWHNALGKSGIKHFRFHDLRHTFGVTWLWKE